MANTVGVRGLACPQPVILTRNALKQHGQVTAIVDSETAQHNVTRMAENAGFTVTAEQVADGVVLHIMGDTEPAAEPAVPATLFAPNGPLVLLVPSEFMGRGDEELGHMTAGKVVSL